MRRRTKKKGFRLIDSIAHGARYLASGCLWPPPGRERITQIPDVGAGMGRASELNPSEKVQVLGMVTPSAANHKVLDILEL